MKKIYTLSLLSLFFVFVLLSKIEAQNYQVVTPGIVYGVAPINEFSDFEIDINNTISPAGNLFLTWDSISSGFPAGWMWTLCDKGGCYSPLPAPLPHDMDTVKPGQKGFFKLSISPTTCDSGVLKLVVYERGTLNPRDTVEFHVRASCLGVKDMASVNSGVSVYPNPAKNFVALKLKDTQANIRKVSIFDILGNEVLNQNTSSKTDFSRLDISALKQGVYIVRIMDKEGATFSKRLYIN